MSLPISPITPPPNALSARPVPFEADGPDLGHGNGEGPAQRPRRRRLKRQVLATTIGAVAGFGLVMGVDWMRQHGLFLAAVQVEALIPSFEEVAETVVGAAVDRPASLDLAGSIDTSSAQPADGGTNGASGPASRFGETGAYSGGNGRVAVTQAAAAGDRLPRLPSARPAAQADRGLDVASAVAAAIAEAEAALAEGDPTAALTRYQAISINTPDHPRLVRGKAMALLQQGEVAGAIDTYAQQLARTPEDGHIVEQILDLVDRVPEGEAVRTLRGLADRFPQHAVISARLAYRYAGLGELGNALWHMEWATTLAPDVPAYRYNLAVLNDRLGFFDVALDQYRALVESVEAGTGLPTDQLRRRIGQLAAGR